MAEETVQTPSATTSVADLLKTKRAAIAAPKPTAPALQSKPGQTVSIGDLLKQKREKLATAKAVTSNQADADLPPGAPQRTAPTESVAPSKGTHEPSWWEATKAKWTSKEPVRLPGGIPLEQMGARPGVPSEAGLRAQQAYADKPLLPVVFGTTAEAVMKQHEEAAASVNALDHPTAAFLADLDVAGTEALMGLSTPANISILAAMPLLGPVRALRALVDLGFSVQMGKGAYDTYQKAKAEQDPHKRRQMEMSAGISAMFAILAGTHLTREGIGAAREKFGGTAALNDAAQGEYKKKFSDLTDEEKASVLYKTAEKKDPVFRHRVEREVARMNREHPLGQVPPGETGAYDLEAEQAGRRLAAQQKVTADLIQQRVRDRTYRQRAAQAEARARYNQEKAMAGEGGTSLAERRGFGVEESRHIELGYQRELDLERDHMRAAVTGKTQIPRDTEAFQQAEALNKTANELYQHEYRYLAPQQKIEVLNRHLATVDPGLKARVDSEMVEAAKAAPDRGQIRTQVAGIAQTEADRMAATRKVLADVQAKYADERAKAGEGGISAASKRGFAIEDKRHIQLGNLRELYLDASSELGGAEGPPAIETQQEGGAALDVRVSPVLAGIQMASREAIAADVRTEMNKPVVEEAQKDHAEGVKGAIDKAATTETREGEGVTAKVQSAMEVAKKMGAKSFEEALAMADRFRQNLGEPADPQMQEFMRRVRTAEIAAENSANRRTREEIVQAIYSDPEAGREHAAREVARTQNRLQTVRQQIAITGDATEKAQLQRLAEYLQRRSDAIVAAAELTAHVPVEGEATREAPKPVILPAIPAVPGRAGRVVLNSGEEVPIHYAVVEAGDLITSHVPTAGFDYDERYPRAAQPRDYKTDKRAQGGVYERASKLDAGQLHSNSVLPVDGPPVIQQNGVVLGGNGRTMSIREAIRLHPEMYEAMRRSLMDNALTFGVTPEEIAKMKSPVLVRVMDENVTDQAELARYEVELNRDPVRGITAEQQGIALGKMLTQERIEQLAAILKDVPPPEPTKPGEAPRPVTIREIMRRKSAALAQWMRDVGMMDPTKEAEYFTSEGELNDASKNLFEKVLAGQAITRPEVLENAPLSVIDKLARVGGEFIKMKAAGAEWDVSSFNTDAVALLTAAQDLSSVLNKLQGAKETGGEFPGGESLIERYLHPERFRLSNFELGFDGQPQHPAVHPAVEALAMALEESPKEYLLKVGRYADRAEAGGATMFGAEHPADVFTNQVASHYGLKVDPAEWGMVNGLPADAREAIEEGRGPLPLEPEEGKVQTTEAVEPDNATVDDIVRGKEIKEVGDFRTALVNHPNISVEMADAITQVFEHILPRAIGESFEDMLRNRRFVMKIGGVEGAQRGYTSMFEDGTKLLHLFESADTSSVMHEMFHVIRDYINPGDQAVLNKFVGAKAGEEWTYEQEERAATAFERYHYDGGRRRGLLDKVFGKISRAMQSIYNAVTSRNLATPSDEVKAMFDRWYDWERTERKPITKKVNVEDLENYIKGDQGIPENATRTSQSVGAPAGYVNARVMPFMTGRDAAEFLKRNKIQKWEMFRTPGENEVVYLKFDAKGKKLYQGPPEDMLSIAKRARDLEEVLKRTTDPREQARIRAALNALDDKLGGSTFVLGTEPKQVDNEARQLIYGLSEMPSTAEPTTPSQAATVRQTVSDPTAVDLGGEHGEAGRTTDLGKLSEKFARLREQERTGGVPEPARPGDRGDEGAEPRTKRGGTTERPKANPLDDVKAATILAPERKRGTPVVDPATWKEHIEELGLPEGTPPPTIRVPQDVRDMMIYPGQSEAVDLALSALQQHDGVIIAAPTGAGKTFLATAIADQLLGTSGEKVGLIVTRSRNLITALDGYKDVGAKMGVDIDVLPKTMAEVQTGVYASTYARIRGDAQMLTIPWDFVIFDESSEARRWSAGSQQGEAAMKLGHAAKKAVYMSATPFHTAVEVGYMHKLGLWPHGGFFGWARQFGVTEVAPNTYAGGYAPKKLVKLRQQLIERGQWISLYRDLDGVSAHVAMVEMTPQTRQGIRQIRSVFKQAQEIFRERGKSNLAMSAMAHEVIYLKRYIEAARLEDAMDLTRKAIDSGWNPVIFTEYRSGTETGMAFFDKFLPPGVGKQLNAQLPKLPDIVEAFRKKFPDEVAIFAGSASELREEERQSYLRGEKPGVYATYAAGGFGVSFHDKVGNRPRMGIFLGLPWSGVTFEQSMGRTWRYGTESGVANIFLTSNALPELKVLATKILPRMRALNAAVYGADIETSLAKKLRESTGIPEEMIDYELGGEASAEGAHFEIDGEGADFTHLRDLEMPDAEKAKNNGMKYRHPVKKLYQGPVEPKYKFGNTQTTITGEAAVALEGVRSRIPEEDLAGKGKDVDGNHLTIRYGVKDGDVGGIAAYIESLSPFEVSLDKTEKFEASIHSDGAAVIVAPVQSEDLHNIHAEIEKHGDFTEPSFAEYKPHATVAYVKPEVADKYVGIEATSGKKFTVDRIAITDRNGDRKVFELAGKEIPKRIKKLYQGEIGPDDPFTRAAREGLEKAKKRLANLPVPVRAAMDANAPIMVPIAADAGREAMGPPSVPPSTPKDPLHESPENAVHRKLSDMELNALYAIDKIKAGPRNVGRSLRKLLWYMGTSGDIAAEKICASVDAREAGIETKRMLIDRDIRFGNYIGELQAQVRKIYNDYHLSGQDLERVSRIIEGGEPDPNDDRISKAVADFRQFFAGVRQGSADRNLYVGVVRGGQLDRVYYADMQDDPNYWMRIYDWNKKIPLTDPKTGEITVTTLREIMNMPDGDERREQMLQRFAAHNGISLMQAQLFFDKNRRGIRLAGNVERARQNDIPGYGRDKVAVNQYIYQVAEKWADAEVFGQDREKFNPVLWSIRDETARRVVDRVVTSDLDPARLNDDDATVLRAATNYAILTKMTLSPLKVMFHMPRGVASTNLLSFLRGALVEPVKDPAHPVKSVRAWWNHARDVGALAGYTREALFREQGLRRKGLGGKVLDFNGFTALIYLQRAIGAGVGRIWLEKDVYPALVKDPQNSMVRAKLKDLYGYNDEMIDRMIREGYNNDDIARVSQGATNWMTGSGRPSELPMALRGKVDDPVSQNLSVYLRIAWALHSYMFKTANLVNRVTFSEGYEGHRARQLLDTAILMGSFELAGAALHGLRGVQHKAAGSQEAEIDKRRQEWIAAHPFSSEQLFWQMSNVAMGMALTPVEMFFEELATHDPKDRAKIASQHRTLNSALQMFTGPVYGDIWKTALHGWDLAATYRDTGEHKKTPEERRATIRRQAATDIVPALRYVLPKPPEPPTPPSVRPRLHGTTRRRPLVRQ